MSLATLGDEITFGVNTDKVYTFTDLERSGESRWSEQEVYSTKPVLEFLGPGLDTLTLSVRFDKDRGVDPSTEIAKFRKLRDTGAIVPFIVGDKVLGNYVLKGIGQELRRFDPKGGLICSIVKLTLREYA